jgi:predicted Zn-dependent protease
MAIAYGRNGDMAMSSLAMAEEAAIQGKTADARFFADRAKKGLPPDSPYRLQAEDILRTTEEKSR